MISKRTLLLLGIVIAAGFIITILVVVFSPSENKNKDLTVTQSTQDAVSENTQGITITNLPILNNMVQSSDITSFTTSVNTYLSQADLSGSYNASIRDGSITKEEDGGITLTTFIIDIASIQRSYKASIGDDTSTGQHTLYTLCVSDDERMYPVFKCNDDLNDA